MRCSGIRSIVGSNGMLSSAVLRVVRGKHFPLAALEATLNLEDLLLFEQNDLWQLNQYRASEGSQTDVPSLNQVVMALFQARLSFVDQGDDQEWSIQKN